MIALVATVEGVVTVDLETGETGPGTPLPERPRPTLNLPRIVAAAAEGSTVVAVVEARPPMLVSHDSGATWRESGRGLPPGFAVAISPDDLDLLLYAARNRLFVSRNGGVFWTALPDELPDITAVSFG
ncbi:MAG: hypothetical protein WCH31_01135 [Actinomycetes bacterium]